MAESGENERQEECDFTDPVQAMKELVRTGSFTEAERQEADKILGDHGFCQNLLAKLDEVSLHDPVSKLILEAFVEEYVIRFPSQFSVS